jgi:hypothetical protein
MTVYAGQGTILKLTISAALTAIAQVLEIGGPEASIGVKDTTNLSHVAKRKRPQLPDGGSITATIQYDPADTTHAALTTAIGQWPTPTAAAEIDWPVGTPGTHKAAFSCFLTKFAPKGMNEEDNLEADIELEIDGVVTWS